MKNRFLKLENINYQVGSKKILENISFILKKGEILSIIGPSGSGKSTILKVIAGLIKPTLGKVVLSNEILTSNNILVPTGKRNIGLMFQEDVLFPHYNVYKNIEFGIQDIPKQTRQKLMIKLLNEFKLTNLAKLYPEKLSGGEKQRVALARILITKPKILLMDEPFSSLDYNLSKEISEFTIRLLRENKISVILVTHDIKAALRVSDKILLINNGEIIQRDTPQKIYNNPSTQFAAEFIGDINKIRIKVKKDGEIQTPFGMVSCLKCNKTLAKCSREQHFCLIRPEDFKFSKSGLKCKVLEKSFLGDSWEYKVVINKKLPALKVRTENGNLEKNNVVNLKVNTKKILVF